MTTDPQVLVPAIFLGVIPSLIWLWFWLKEEKKDKEPKLVLATIFIFGMILVFFTIPIQKLIQNTIHNEDSQIVLWALVEEILKFLAVLILFYNTRYIDEPIDWPIYLITSALGFAAMENFLFLVKPFSLGDATVGILTGQLRFLGSTLLHSLSSAIIGISLGLSYFMTPFSRKTYLFFGIFLATALHSLFNFFIIKSSENDFLTIFAFLWVVAIIIMLIFEKLRRMSNITN